ncbi:divergent PAP2 family protein [Marivivens sp. JLT3646]|uniref:divergent PAP2 family protein n=1 Tax=Marivivens sp. JLT3646 TaxID=1920883 RepID=UPI0008008FA7|nr:divergent PAP2 family protein [Marivivens sp. JLT3646]APO88554.1 acid phosphatase [Marivivens sp. JLT3646]OBR39254.1 acid phosphatase [Donghicola sp. JL3646]
MMDLSYTFTPFLTWFVAGLLKFIVNSFKVKKLAFGLIGNGGLPSNHSAIVSSIVTLVALKEGFDHPSFGVAMAFGLIVLLDANGLRLHVGYHAEAINKLTASLSDFHKLRERMGHTIIEIIAGIILGASVAFCMNIISA